MSTADADTTITHGETTITTEGAELTADDITREDKGENLIGDDGDTLIKVEGVELSSDEIREMQDAS